MSLASALAGKLFHHQGGVVSAETKRVVQSYTHLFLPRSVGGEIEITFFIGVIEIDRRRDHPIAYGQGADRHLDRACSTQQMAGHRFGWANRNASRPVAENSLDRARLSHVAETGRSSVGIDVIHFID